MTKHTSTRRFLVTAIVAMTITASFPFAQKVSDAELLFREAQHKQQVERDLNGAIRIYESIAASKTADRAVKAKALLQLAGCYEMQGTQAEKVYDQIVRDYKDQPAVVAQAQAKLAALHPQTSAPKVTKIEFGNGVRHVAMTDGRRAVYWNDEHTTLYLGDVAGKTRHVVFTAQQDQRPARVLASPDLSMVFIAFTPAPVGNSPGTIRPGRGILKNTDGTGGREIDAFGWFSRPPGSGGTVFFGVEWSGNGRYLLASVQHDAQTHLAKISVNDGQVTLLSPISGSLRLAASSPDDRFIALSGDSGLHIIPSQGGEPRRLVADAARLARWTRDGKYILFSSPQSNSLSAIPVKDGQLAGERIALAGTDSYQVFVTDGGSIVLQKQGGESQPPLRQKLYLASIDDNGNVSPWKAQDVTGVFSAYPTWSPDSSQFAYVEAGGPGENPVRIHTVAGQDRVLFAGVRQTVMNGTIGNCLWASSQPIIYCGAFLDPSAGTQLKGGVLTTNDTNPFKTRVISIRTDTGRMEEVGVLSGIRFLERLSPDDRSLISAKFGPDVPPASRAAAHRWEIGTSGDTETSFAEVVESNVTESPDGRWVYRVVANGSNRREYQIRLTSGSDADWKSLMHVNRPAPQKMSPIQFHVPIRYTPDSKWIVYQDKDASGKDGLFRVSTSGGEPHRLGDYPTSDLSSLLSISPDGRKILVHVDARQAFAPVLGFREFDFALLENFNPRPPTAPRPAAKAVKK